MAADPVLLVTLYNKVGKIVKFQALSVLFCIQIVVMSQSRAEGFSARLDSASENGPKTSRKLAENELKFDSQFS